MKKLIFLLIALLAMPLFADDAQEATPQTPPPTAEQQPQQTPPPAEPTPEQIEKESFAEVFTDLKNTVDALNRMKISGYVLAQYVNDETSVNEVNGAATRNKDQFSVREARLKFAYQFASTSRVVVQPEFAGSGVTLKDGFVEFTEPWTTWRHTLTAGQFNWPFGFEIEYSSSLRELPERSRVIRTLFPGERDRGVQLSGAGLEERLKYKFAIVNGSGTGRTDDANKRKDFLGRLGYTFGPLDLGASIYRGSDLVATATNAKGIEFDKERQGIDFQWITPIQGLGIRGEYITGKQAPPSGTTRSTSFDVEGWYLYAIQNIGTRHQLALRVDEYDGNTDASGDAIRTIGGSYTFFWDGNSRVMAAYEIPRNERNDVDDNIFILRYAFVF